MGHVCPPPKALPVGKEPSWTFRVRNFDQAGIRSANVKGPILVNNALQGTDTASTILFSKKPFVGGQEPEFAIPINDSGNEPLITVVSSKASRNSSALRNGIEKNRTRRNLPIGRFLKLFSHGRTRKNTEVHGIFPSVPFRVFRGKQQTKIP